MSQKETMKIRKYHQHAEEQRHGETGAQDVGENDNGEQQGQNGQQNTAISFQVHGEDPFRLIACILLHFFAVRNVRKGKT